NIDDEALVKLLRDSPFNPLENEGNTIYSQALGYLDDPDLVSFADVQPYLNAMNATRLSPGQGTWRLIRSETDRLRIRAPEASLHDLAFRLATNSLRFKIDLAHAGGRMKGSRPALLKHLPDGEEPRLRDARMPRDNPMHRPFQRGGRVVRMPA